MKIAVKSIAWTDPNAGQGVANFLIYYAQGSDVQFAYELPSVAVPCRSSTSPSVSPGGLAAGAGSGAFGEEGRGGKACKARRKRRASRSARWREPSASGLGCPTLRPLMPPNAAAAARPGSPAP